MKSILLVEDDDLKANILRRALQAESLEVVRVSTLVLAMDTLTNEALRDSIGAVVMDWTFPIRADGDPVEYAGRRLVMECQEVEIPFIVVSGREDGAPKEFSSIEWIKFHPSVDVRSQLKDWVARTKEKVPALLS